MYIILMNPNQHSIILCIHIQPTLIMKEVMFAHKKCKNINTQTHSETHTHTHTHTRVHTDFPQKLKVKQHFAHIKGV